MTLRLIRSGACIAAFAALMAGPVMAQQAGAEPTFADLNLEAGFDPDPQTIQITAGGDKDASVSPGGECVGMIAETPDIRLTYKPDQLPLHIEVTADADTTLVVKAPNGQWICNDDTDESFDPKVSFTSPQAGVYEIWVGTYDAEPVPAVVAITELD